MGIQEKQTFIQVFAKPSSLYVAQMWLPGLIQLLLLLIGIAVLFHHAPPAADAAAAASQRRQYEADGYEAAALVTAQLSETDELHPDDSHSA